MNVIEQFIGPDIAGHPVWNLRTKVIKCPDTATHPVWNLRTKQEQLLDKGYIPLCSLRVMALSLLLFPGPFSPHIREYKTVLDFEFHAKDSGFQELASNFMSVEPWILDSSR